MGSPQTIETIQYINEVPAFFIEIYPESDFRTGDYLLGAYHMAIQDGTRSTGRFISSVLFDSGGISPGDSACAPHAAKAV